MKIVEIEYSRTFNLGDYESEKISLRAEITEGITVQEVYERLNEEIVKLHLLEKKFKIAEKQMKKQVSETPKIDPAIHPQIKNIKEELGEEFNKLVNVNLSDDKKTIIVKGKEYLPADKFGRIYNIIQGTFGGRYVSDGANSHFVVDVD